MAGVCVGVCHFLVLFAYIYRADDSHAYAVAGVSLFVCVYLDSKGGKIRGAPWKEVCGFVRCS